MIFSAIFVFNSLPMTNCSYLFFLCSSAVRQYKTKEGKVVFTLQDVSEDKTCLEFRIIQESEVEQLKSSVAKVHDFYRPEERNIKVGIILSSSIGAAVRRSLGKCALLRYIPTSIISK